ncbi:DUF397 domain-containing protein [Streptomyces sp. NPDC006172]|uniref:DUF397 domain-containing protein n=1 Tax=Streptomyces sp. NPDC006172 TaxID=3154470 RepID=UPI0033C0CC98
MSIAAHSTDARRAWFTSSYSNGAGGECVECRLTDHGAAVRDSKRPEGSVVAVGNSAWSSFVAAVGHADRER